MNYNYDPPPVKPGSVKPKSSLGLLLLLFLIGIGLIVWLILYGQPVSSNSAKGAVNNFFQFWKSDLQANKDYLRNKLITEELKKELGRNHTELLNNDFSSVFCREDKPQSFGIISEELKANSAKVAVRENYYDMMVNIYVDLIRIGKIWKIDGLSCE